MQQPIWQAASAELYGKIKISQGVSIWSNVVMRAESSHIEIGAYSNIQDFTMIHIADGPDCHWSVLLDHPSLYNSWRNHW